MESKFFKYFHTTIWFFFSIAFCHAQPGGGGGLTFGQLYSKDFKAIDLKSPDLKIRNFILAGNGINEELYDIRPLHLIPSKWNYYFDREVACSNQRLLIYYKNEIMIVDLLNILQENGMGNSDRMDSLVFIKGHFTMVTNQYANDRNENRQRNDAILNNGLTPFTTLSLSESGLIKYNNNTDVSFLNEDKLTAHFILKRGVQSFRKEKYDAAITDIYTAIRKGLSAPGREEALSTLSSCYSKKNEFEKSVELLTEIINSRNVKDNYRLMHYYKARIEAYTSLKEYNKALADFDYIILNTLENQTVFIAEKAHYKEKYFSDCASAIQDFENLIDEIPGDHLRDRPGGWSEYADSYFAYGSLEYTCSHFENAFKLWLKAMEFGYAQTSAPYAVEFFDSIIRAFPAEPKPTCCEAPQPERITKTKTAKVTVPNVFINTPVFDELRISPLSPGEG